MQPRLRFVLVLSALVLALAIGAGAADSYARIVRLSYVNGQVELDRDGTSGLDTAFLNMPVANGAQLVTGNDGFAEAEFEAGTTVRLAPNSDLRFRELGLQDGYTLSTLELVDGTAYFNIKHESHDQFHVLLNGQELLVPKSSRFRVVMRPQGAQVSVFKGELRLLGDEETKIGKNETLSLDFQQGGRFSLSQNIETLAYDAWDQEREGYSGRFVSSGSYVGYSSGFSYGWNDLNYFGAFFNVPGYGSCWRPYGFDSYWDPYMDGAWVWYPGWGYTWVSGYPWGWAPYRYGRWVWAAGYGWVWQPGHRWNRWYAYAPVYNPPHNYHPPRPPQHPPVIVGGGTGSGAPHAGGQPGPGAGGTQGRGSGVVVVGKGPFTGLGRNGGPIDTRRARIDVQDLPVAKAGGASASGAGSGRPAPSAITPGVLPNREAVIEQLRKVHGDDLGVRGARTTIQGGAVGASGATGVQGQTGMQGQTATGATVGTSGGSQPKQQPVVIMPPSPQPHGGAGAANVHEQIQVQPQVQAQPQPHNPPPIVMPPQPAHPTPPPQPSTPPPSSPQTSGSSGGSGSHWSGSSGGSSGGSHGGSSGGSSSYSSGSSGGSHSGGSSSASGGSHSSSSSSGSHSSSSGSGSGSHSSSSSHDPK